MSPPADQIDERSVQPLQRFGLQIAHPLVVGVSGERRVEEQGQHPRAHEGLLGHRPVRGAETLLGRLLSKRLQ